MRGSLVALVTPMDAAGDVDYPAVDRLIDWHADSGTAALVVAGTTGESATLTHDEHAELIRYVAGQAGGRIPVVAGTGSNSTAQTIALSQAVAGSGIVAFLVVTPYYNKPTQEGMFRHFTAIADAVEQPLILYNVPVRTAVDLLPETVGRLAEHPRIGALKEATGEVERVGRLRALCGEGFSLYSGDDATARDFMLAGGDGVISVTANVAPRAMADMCGAALAGDSARAAESDAPLAALHDALFLESNPIPVKWALNRMNRIGAGIRLPLTELSVPHHAQVQAALTEARALS
ncbi:MAG: 4-hydroxy-tetrahydrodipicolinate synthase [Gammaproteobacteria bacterium]|nr:4-hydroxy-tetrahydrodipicolinate synthase [Gammaproteobacteria bacterium]MYF66878.1 4-hydroxy-tetrahydrodipicolinate synthase [Gammaproteobacteria bacterium]MYK36310.1 4-hydroxy-tetrahydrodipicolinate synthase [Gammaproteobacteria bacterium]